MTTTWRRHVVSTLVLVALLAAGSECDPTRSRKVEGRAPLMEMHRGRTSRPGNTNSDEAEVQPDGRLVGNGGGRLREIQGEEELLYGDYVEFDDHNIAMKEFSDLKTLLENQVRNDSIRGALPLPAMKEEHTRRTFLNLVPLYLPDAGSANAECRRDLLALYRSITVLEDLVKNGTLWPLRLVDSWGKFADGMLVGNINLMGFFKECVGISVAQEDAEFEGQYCWLMYGPKPNTSKSNSEYLPTQNSHDLRTPMLSPILPASGLTAYSTCMPSTCTQEELVETVNAVLGLEGYKLNIVECQVKNPPHEYSAGEIFGMVFFSVLAAVLILATVLDVWDQHHNEHKLQRGPAKYLLVFSINQNLPKLFHLDTKRNPAVISCLHGIRFLSICWVVLGHQYAYSAQTSLNVIEILDILKPTAFQMISNGDLSVDTFFLMSGMLVSIGLLKHMSKVGKFNAVMYYLHRVIRLLPPIAIADAFLATLSGLLVTGPLAGLYRSFYQKGCRHSWWMDVILMNNLFFPYLEEMGKTNEGSTCLPHCWYVGVDTQLYILVPLMLLPLYYRKRKGQLWLALWTAASLIIPSVITGVYNLWPTSMMSLDSAASLEYNYKVYLMPWCRASPYLVGLWAGYIIQTAMDSPQYKKLHAWQVWTGWGTSAAVAWAVVFGISRYNYIGLDVPQMSLAEAVLYGGLHRAAWAAAVAWVVVACHWGYGGPINWFLSHPCWQPLSRLTYCIYLTSLPIQFALLYATPRPHYYSNITKIQETCGVLFIVILVSIALTLVSESPILRLEKLLLTPPAPKKERRESAAFSGMAPSPSTSHLVSSSSREEETSEEIIHERRTSQIS